MDANATISNFRDAILVSFDNWQIAMNALSETDQAVLSESFGDLAQVHWELFVEQILCQPNQFLEIYGSGSDLESAAHSRVFFHDATPTHEIVCRARCKQRDFLSGNDIDVNQWHFDRFVSFENNWYAESPPFDHLLLSNGTSGDVAVVSLSDLSFEMTKLPNAV